jgi:hypothetical protein
LAVHDKGTEWEHDHGEFMIRKDGKMEATGISFTFAVLLIGHFLVM